MSKEQKQKIYANGTQKFYNEKGQIHRDNDLPAIIRADGYKAWYQNGKLHRDNDKPAVIGAAGYQHWYQNGNFIKRERGE